LVRLSRRGPDSLHPIVGSPNSKIGAAKRCAGTLFVMALEEASPALAEVAGWRFGLIPSRRLRLFVDPTIGCDESGRAMPFPR
jgi:hypothetical protein